MAGEDTGTRDARICCVCPNPTIDIWSQAGNVHPVHKIRTSNETYDPGGGGVNVARAVSELGGNVEVMAFAGGVTGALLGELLDGCGIPHTLVPIAERTRISNTVHDLSSGFDYRFVSEGPRITPDEITALLDRLRNREFAYLVASGSAPPGLSPDFFRELGEIARQKNALYVLDTSDEGLKAGLDGGNVFLVKPSIGELSGLFGEALDEASAHEAAMELVRRGSAQMVAVSMGARGALLATRTKVIRSAAPMVHVKSTVGTGDSFLGAMLWALSEGHGEEEALAYGIAAGAAAVLNPGTKLCSKRDVEHFMQRLKAPTVTRIQ